MKVKDVIDALSKLDPETDVYICGYEGGVHDYKDPPTEKCYIQRDVNAEWYYGEHESSSEKDEKFVHEGYVL
jgi:hypothetical protein